MARQQSLLKPKHDSLHASRLNKYTDRSVCNAERIYLAEWKRFNHGTDDKLAMILWSDKERGKGHWPPTPSNRDRAVAASVIQWLATTVGNSFLQMAERKVGRGDALAQARHNFKINVDIIQYRYRADRAARRRDFVNKASNRIFLREKSFKVRVDEVAKQEAEREQRRKTTMRAIQIREEPR